MASRIEDVIAEMEEYIDSCKPAAFSSSKIVVNRDEIDALLEELRSKTPEEIKRYQKIINNKEAILADAQAKADAIIAQAQIQTNELVSEHQIMQQAYAQANDVVNIATKQAQEMLDKATEDANSIRSGAIEYTDQLLEHVQGIIEQALNTTTQSNAALIKAVSESDEQFRDSMNGYLDLIRENRGELHPTEAPDLTDEPQPQISEAESDDSSTPDDTVDQDTKKKGDADKKASDSDSDGPTVSDELFS